MVTPTVTRSDRARTRYGAHLPLSWIAETFKALKSIKGWTYLCRSPCFGPPDAFACRRCTGSGEGFRSSAGGLARDVNVRYSPPDAWTIIPIGFCLVRLTAPCIVPKDATVFWVDAPRAQASIRLGGDRQPKRKNVRGSHAQVMTVHDSLGWAGLAPSHPTS